MSEIIFQNKHQPNLLPGEYKITVSSSLDIEGVGHKRFSSDYQFCVAGDRFSLAPTQIHSVFPPPGNLGEHSYVMPHIVFNRSTLPWERDAVKAKNAVPWLALLLFEENEAPATQTMTLDELNASGADFPYLELERGQQGSDSLNVIDVPKALLEKILPVYQDLPMLAHVRKDTAGVGEGAELAVVVCNRLPLAQGNSVVHLVSLEARLTESGFKYETVPSPTELVRLISLHSWKFSCITPMHSFKEILKGLDQGAFRLPKNSNAESERNLARGASLLPYKLRNGDRGYAWYQGPLSPGTRFTDITQAYLNLPVRSADELSLYNADYGLFDVSYAAAWELGRSMILRDADMALKLYRWKRSYARGVRKVPGELGYLPDLVTQTNNIRLPVEVENWFKGLQCLENIPFCYLVCDETLLPAESIRFFCLDSLWVDCLLDGAFSVGRISEQDVAVEKRVYAKNPALVANKNVSGFLLRSELVSGWPALETIAYDHLADPPLNLLRKVKLGDNILLCLFDGEIKHLDIQQKAEALHYGLDSDDTGSNFTKGLRKLSAEASEPGVLREHDGDIPWRDKGARVINVKALADNIKNRTKENDFTSADFSLQMVEGVECVRFSIKGAI